jgi:hypothetical protein
LFGKQGNSYEYTVDVTFKTYTSFHEMGMYSMWNHFCYYFSESENENQKQKSKTKSNSMYINDHTCAMNHILRRKRMKVFVALSNGYELKGKYKQYICSPRSVAEE